MKTKWELAHVIRRFGSDNEFIQSLTPLQAKVLQHIKNCRTASLGGHKEQCDCCGETRFSYNSCGDRHCPKCQAAKQALWVDKLVNTTLPVKHFHSVFTVPHCLNKIALFNQKVFYNLLFKAVWETLRTLGYTHYGVETGAVCVLHTWGQNLSLHPHIHCIIPAAGYSLSGKWRQIGKSGNYLFPVHQLSTLFKGKFLDALKRWLRKINILHEFNDPLQQAWNTDWVVFSEPSLAKADHVIRYLGQYTHRVAITNQRITNISESHVSFVAKDYRKNRTRRITKLPGKEFLRRFTLHILPLRFVKIRRYGIYNETTKHNLQLRFTSESIEDKNRKKETAKETLKRITGFDANTCPLCKKGKMIIVEILPRIRSPANQILSQKISM